jgi:hypothetical protein
MNINDKSFYQVQPKEAILGAIEPYSIHARTLREKVHEVSIFDELGLSRRIVYVENRVIKRVFTLSEAKRVLKLSKI